MGDVYAQSMEDYRALLKQIRNTEGSVHPTRENRNKVADEIQKLKYRDPTNARLETLEQELVRAEAHNLVAEAQLTNVTRQNMKEGFDIHFAAVIERGEKQILLARHARRLLNYIDDTPIVPGDQRGAYEHATAAKQVLEEAENDLRSWERTDAPIATSAEQTESNLLPPTNKARESTITDHTAEGTADGTESVRTSGAVTADGVDTNPVHPQASGAIGTKQPVAVPY